MKEIRVGVPDADTVMRNGKRNGARDGYHALALYSAGKLDMPIRKDPQAEFVPILSEVGRKDFDGVQSPINREYMDGLRRDLEKVGLSGFYGKPLGEMNSQVELSAQALNAQKVVFLEGDVEDNGGFDSVITADLESDVRRVLSESNLSHRQMYTIVERFFRGEQLKTIGESLGVTGERARQIQNEALKKLRESGLFHHLRDYLRE